MATGLSINDIYVHLSRCIKLLSIYTGNKKISSIIKMCRLKPVNYINSGRRLTKTILYDKWVDEFGTTLNLKNKKFKVILNDTSITDTVNTDMYYGYSINNISKISSNAYLFRSNEEDISCVWFYGIDKFIRCFMNHGDGWYYVSPLIFGTKVIERIIGNLNNNIGFNFKNEPIGCDDGMAWLYSLPVSGDFFKEIMDLTNIDPNFR